MEQAWEVDRDAFHKTLEKKSVLTGVDPERLLGLFLGDRLIALCGALPFGQYFGGRSVPMGGLSTVAVVPDQRGRGHARRVISGSLEEMRERGEVLSTLFPAATQLYRDLGWEVAGAYLWRTVAPEALRGLPVPETGRLRPGGAGDFEAVRTCYDRFARSVNGFVDRPESWWWRSGELWRDRSIFVAEGNDGEVEGYLVYRQLDGEYSSLGGPFQLVVEEVLAATRDATLALWRLLASWSSQVDRLLFRGSPEDPLLLLLPDQPLTTLAELRSMTRVVDAAGAVAARGFPSGVEAEVQLELSDPQLAGNRGRFVLSVSKGRGRLEPGGGGAVELDIGAFSSLYTGWASTATLRRAGRLAGGTPASCEELDAVFAGPTPWMLDEF
jgi:predicted acetyltransferase